MVVRTIPPQTLGFDCNTPINYDQARAFMRANYRFVLRYLPRVTHANHDLTAAEVNILLRAGLAIMPVQHVEAAGWDPTAEKGINYGKVAGESALKCGIASGTSVWLDLEGIRGSTDHETVIQYCNRWYDQVAAAGFLPGIYVGWQAILTADELYHRLKFTRYWSAYNLNDDQFPSVVGVCMRQREAHAPDYPDGFREQIDSFDIDQNIVMGDAHGRLPMAMAPGEWDVIV